MIKTLGVDVSHWEGVIDWKVASHWVPFVYYKCTDGANLFDPTFPANKQGCIDAGIPHAPYHWYKPLIDPHAQAAYFINKAGKGYKRLIVDVEEGKVDPNSLYVLLLDIERLSGGIKPAIYTSAGFWNEFVYPKPAWAKNYDLIVAHYTREHQPILPIGWSTWRIWQFSDYWFFPGCTEIADADWFNGDLQACRDWFGNYREILPPLFSHTQIRSQFNNLHIRQEPKVSAHEIGHLRKDEIIEVEDLGGADVWVRHSRGWTSVERDGYRYMEVIK